MEDGGYAGGAKEDDEERTHVKVESRAGAPKTDQSSTSSAAFVKEIGNMKIASCDSSNNNNANND
jgi:hypothetical protein